MSREPMKIETRDHAPHVVRTGWTEQQGSRAVHVALVVKFGLHHLSGNKAPYFSITADGYEDGRESFCGCCHEIIAERLPELADVIALHLSDIDGSPKYAASNAWYWLAGVVDVGEQYHGGSGSSAKGAGDCLRIFCNHVRVDEKTALAVIGKANKTTRAKGKKAAREEFDRWIDTQRPRWKAEANALIRKYGFGVYGHNFKTPAELAATLQD